MDEETLLKRHQDHHLAQEGIFHDRRELMENYLDFEHFTTWAENRDLICTFYNSLRSSSDSDDRNSNTMHLQYIDHISALIIIRIQRFIL